MLSGFITVKLQNNPRRKRQINGQCDLIRFRARAIDEAGIVRSFETIFTYRAFVLTDFCHQNETYFH